MAPATLSVIAIVSCLALGSEASSFSTERVYTKVRYRVRDLVAMLHSMQKRVEKEGEDDAELFKRYMQYCRKGRSAMLESIKKAEDVDLDGLESAIEGEEKTREEIERRIVADQAKQAKVNKSIVAAKDNRDHGLETFSDESIKIREDLAILKHAVSALDKDGGLEELSSMRTPVAFVLKRISGSLDIKEADRKLLRSFLDRVKRGPLPERQEVRSEFLRTYEVLKKRLSEVIAEEEGERQSFQDYQKVIQHKTKDLKSDIEHKEREKKELDAEVASNKESVANTARYLMEGPAFLPFISDSENCSMREEEWGERAQVRTNEIAAIAESIGILTDEALLDKLLQKSLPKPWQEVSPHAIAASKESVRRQESNSQFDLLSLAMKGKNASVSRILKILGGMVALLGNKESTATQETFCGQSLNQTEGNLKKLTFTVSDLGTIISQHEQSVLVLASEINDLQDGVQKLDQYIVDSAQVRKQQNEENAEIATGDTTTFHLFQEALIRMRAFYSAELPKSSIATSVPLAEIIGLYQKNSVESDKIFALLEASLKELGSDISKVEAAETKDQNVWETVVKESLQKHAGDMKMISAKQGAKADLAANLASKGKEKTQKIQELKQTSKYLDEMQGKHTAFLSRSVCSRRSAVAKGVAPMPKHTMS